jgi:hypothetical protein
MVIGRDHQKALWLVLYNFHGLFLLQQMQQVSNFEDDRSLMDRHALAINHLDHCLSIMELVRESNGKNNKMVIFNRKSMEIIARAADSYDPKNTVLNKDDIGVLSKEIAGLQKLVAQSHQYEYTRDELRKAGLK